MDIGASNWNEFRRQQQHGCARRRTRGHAAQRREQHRARRHGLHQALVRLVDPEGHRRHVDGLYPDLWRRTGRLGRRHDASHPVPRRQRHQCDAERQRTRRQAAILLNAVGGWYQAPPALVGVDMVCRVTYHAGTGAYRIIRDQGGVPTGTPLPFGGTTAPAGYLLCFGQAISRTDYAGLFAAVGTVHGAGNGSTTFNVPDLRGRVAAGKDDMGGSSASRLSSVISSTVLGYGGRCPDLRT